MSTTYVPPTPEVAAAMEESAACQVKIMASLIGFMGLCCIILGVFFIYHFYKPLKKIDIECGAIELRITIEENENKWWIDDDDVV